MLPKSRTKKGHVGSNMTFFSLNPLSFTLLMISPFQGEFRPCPGRSSCCCQHDSYLSNHRHCLRCGASVREAHLRALVWASRAVMLDFRLFFCSEAYVNASRCASRWAGPDLPQLSRSDAYVRPSGCASPYSVEYRFSAPPAISIAIPLTR